MGESTTLCATMLAVIAAAPLFDPDGASTGDLSPLERVAGLPLVLRTVLSLQKAGADRILVLLQEADPGPAARVLTDPRVVVPTEVAPLAADTSPWQQLAAQVAEPCLLTPLRLVADPEIYRRLLDPSLEGSSATVAVAEGRPIGPVQLGRAPGDLATAREGDGPLLDRLAADEGAALLDVATLWSTSVDSPAGRARATHLLFEACRKSVDGAVSRHINRHVSLFLSKRLVHTPLSPNGATIITFLVGVVAAWFVAQGGYLNTVIGATLFQLNSILDGVDGELARVRFQQSKLGQWLDTIGDDAALLLFYAALAIGTRDLPHGLLWSTCAWIAAAATALSALLYYTELARIGSGDLYAIEWDFDKKPPAGLRDRVVLLFRTILKQDFFVFVIFCAAVLGVLHYALTVFATGGVITVIAAAARRIQNARRGKPPTAATGSSR
ncbi:MAG: CDP-alcohol phosphatidyltransferase family protein [Deltaproteobacteria bacterium]|nr:CDP-alcohol phosphatidyltransferase family protein [Deltaproteobacteria bacterium]MBW2533913.1 CDP-alcohol phosphatidyltransferase family protein [Deltaproteobacteria bacterium]